MTMVQRCNGLVISTLTRRSAPREGRSFAILVVLTFFLFSSSLYAQQRVALEATVAGLSTPVFFTNAKDGTNRRFVIEQIGRIRVLQPGSSNFTTFLDI